MVTRNKRAREEERALHEKQNDVALHRLLSREEG